MRCSQDPDSSQWRIEFNPSEALLVFHSFQQMAEQYRLSVEDLPPALQDYWRGRISESGNPEELSEARHQLEEERIAWRGERLPLVERWIADYRRSGIAREWTLVLSRDEVENVMIIWNDRRLTLATEHELTETLMDLDEVADESLRHVLLEVELLGNLQGLLLEHIQHAENNDVA